MANLFEFQGYQPVVHESAFIHPQATVIGNVVIGADVYVGPGARLRGDWGEIVIGNGANVQENCVIHMFPGITVLLEDSAHIGHGSIIHGATVRKNALVGMNSVLMDRSEVGEGSILGAQSFLPENMEIPSRKLAVGSPARVIKDVSDEMLAWKTKGTELYQALPKECHASLRPCEPLREVPADRPSQSVHYQTWTNQRAPDKKD